MGEKLEKIICTGQESEFSLIKQHLKENEQKIFKVLELGSGTGLAGLAFYKLFAKKHPNMSL